MKTFKKKLLGLCFLLLMAVSCDKDESEGNGLYTVSGRLTDGAAPVKNAQVDLDDMIQFSTTSDETGYFEIKNVPAGTYMLNTSFMTDNGSFSKINEQVLVAADLFLEALKLPEPVSIENGGIEVNETNNNVKLVWNRYTGVDFREYKVYRHETSGLDENTGTLVHVTTVASDTSFSLTLPHNRKTYFRVFVLDEFGLLGGSNVLEVDTTFPFDPLLVPGAGMKTYYISKGQTQNFYFNSVKETFYAVTWNDSQVSHDGTDFTGNVMTKATREDESINYFDFQGSSQFLNSPRPIRAIANEKINVAVIGPSGNFGNEGTYGLHVQLLDNPIPLSIGSENIVNVKKNEAVIAYFEGEENSTYHVSSVSKRTFFYYPSTFQGPRGIPMTVSIYAGNETTPISYRAYIRCCGFGTDDHDITMTQAGRVYIIVGGDVETGFGYTDNDLGVTITKP